jgi:hypothetical protein
VYNLAMMTVVFDIDIRSHVLEQKPSRWLQNTNIYQIIHTKGEQLRHKEPLVICDWLPIFSSALKVTTL